VKDGERESGKRRREKEIERERDNVEYKEKKRE
jgi:hypothetical protein